MAYAAGQVNVSGIVERNGGRELIVVHTFSRSLFRIVINARNPAARIITRITAHELAGDSRIPRAGGCLIPGDG